MRREVTVKMRSILAAVGWDDVGADPVKGQLVLDILAVWVDRRVSDDEISAYVDTITQFPERRETARKLILAWRDEYCWDSSKPECSP